jgi:hypothetical protein
MHRRAHFPARAEQIVRAPQPQQKSETPPLDPAVIKLIDALARAQAREDHKQENTTKTGSTAG